MAIHKKTDTEALKRLKTKVITGKENASTVTKTDTNTTSRTTSSAPTYSNKTDTEALKRLREKVAQEKGIKTKTTTPTFDYNITPKIKADFSVDVTNPKTTKPNTSNVDYKTTDTTNNEARLEALKNELSAKKIKYTDDYWQSVYDDAMSRFRAEGRGDEPNTATRAWLMVDGLRDSWEKEKEELEKEIRRLSGVRDATWKDATIGSLKRGYEQSRFGEETYKQMMGNENNADAINDILQDEQYQFEADGFIKEAVSGAAEIIGQMGYLYTKPETYPKIGSAMLMGAGTAAAAGQMGPQIGLPEEIATVPAGALLGLKVGMGTVTAENALKVEAGHAYNEMIEHGISHETARNIALGVGTANATLEMLQVDELVDAFKILNKSGATSTVAERIFKELVDRGVDVAKETAQEVAQEGVTMGGTEIAHRIDKDEGLYTSEDVKERLGDVTKSSVLSFGMMNVPATAFNVATNPVKKAIGDKQQYEQQKENLDAIIDDEEKLNKLIEIGKQSGVVASKFAKDVEQAKEQGKTSREQVRKLINVVNTHYNQPDSLEQAARDVVESRNKTNGIELLERRKKGQVTEEILNTLSENNEPITKDEVKKVTGFGDNGAELIAKYSNEDGATFSKVLSEVKSSYTTGLQQPDIDINNVSDAFISKAQQNAFTAGQMDGKMIALAQKEQSAIVRKDAGFDSTNLPNDVTESEVATVDLMAKALGVKSFMTSGLKGNAEINRVTGEVPIDVNFEREIVVDGKPQKVSLVFHAAHEMAVHRVVELAPEEGRAFVYAMYNALAGNEPSTYTLADAKRSDYAKQGVNISFAQAMEEVTANNILRCYDNDITKFHNAIESIVNGEDEQAKKGLRKYIDYLNKMIRKILNFLSGKSAQEKANMQPQLDEITKLRDMFETAFRKAVQNAKTMQNNNTNSTKNLEIKINEEYNGSISHSLYGYPRLSKSEWALLNNRLEIELRNSNNFIDEYTKWLYANKNGTRVFAIYGIGWGDDATPLYAVGGKKAENAYNKMLKFMEEENETFDGSREDFESWVSTYTATKGATSNNISDDGNRGTNIENGTVHSEQQTSNGKRTDDGSTTNSNEVSYSLKQKAPTFYSHMGKTIDDMKQDKIGANSVVSYLKGRGVKDEEIKWSGIEAFLEGKKSVTKEELQEFVVGSMLQIDVKSFADDITITYTQNELDELDRISKDLDDAWAEANDIWNEAYGTNIPIDIIGDDDALSAMTRYVIDQHGGMRNFEGISHLSDAERKIYDDYGNNSITRKIKDLEERQADIADRAKARRDNTKQTKYHQYTLDGGSGNYRELLFKLPNSEYTNAAMSTHWGEKGILAHARVQDFDVDGQKMLFVEEIQSDWHNEGQKEGYKAKLSPAEEKTVKEITDKRTQLFNELRDVLEEIRVTAEKAEKQNLNARQQVEATSALWDKANKLREEERALLAEAQKIEGTSNIPDAPFRNNYHEYVLKNLIRMAAEEGYDSIGWTTSDIQSQRWSNKYAEGYRIEYDQDIPKFLNKYGKKWGAKVGKTVIGREEGHWEDKARWVEKEGNEVWFIPITSSMKDSVLYEGQTMFSLKQSIEETKNLIALHNVREDKLLEAFKLGGLPSPSIAITKKDMLFDKFGDISLIFRKDSISPTDRRNKIYSGDAYTPTGARVEYDIDDDILQEFNKKLKELTPEFTNERLPSVNSGTAEAENDSLYKAYERNDRAKFAFLREKGKAPKVAMRTPTLSGFATNDAIIALAKAFSSKQLNDIANTTEGVKQYKNACLKVIRDNSDSRVVESGIYSADSVSLWDVADVARLAAKVKENKYKIKKEVDNRAIYDLIDKKFTNALKAEYKTWIDENTRDAIIDKGIRNNRDLFTPSGNRRSFKQLHEPYNLSNIVKQMFSGEDKGIALFGGSPIGAAQHLYSSIADVKADSGRIQDLEQEEYDKIRDSIEDDIFELSRKMQINSDVFAVRDLLTEAIGKKTKQQADLHLKRESQGWAKYSPEFTNELWDIRERILNMPTQYFEAKPQRAVGFNEVVAAIIPRNKDKSLKTELENRGIKVLEYSKEKDGDRLKKINSVSDVSFSLKGTNNTNYKDHQDLVNTIEHLKNEFKVTKFAKADPKKLETMTKKLLKEYSSQADFNETFSAINSLYEYMANGEDGHPAVWQDMYSKAYNVARDIIEDAIVVYDELYHAYRDLRMHLRSVGIKFDPEYNELPSRYDSFNEMRRMNFGRLNFTKKGSSIDGVYQELSSLYPEFFDASQETNSSAQLEKIIDTLDSLQPTEANPYSNNMRMAASLLANDIIDNFFDIPQAKPTFADKAQQRVVDARISGIHKIEAVRKQRDEKIKKLKAAQKVRIKQLIEKSRDSKEEAIKVVKDKHKARLSKMSETKKVQVLRAKIIRHTGELNKTLLKATDKKHIPPELENAVLTLLYNINMESNYSYDVKTHSYKKNNEGLPTNKTKAFQQLKAVYEEIAKNNDYGLTIASELYDATNAGIGNIFDELMKLSDKKISDMTSEELTKVYDAIRLVEHSIATANKMFAIQKWEGLTQTAKAFEKSVATRRPMPSVFNKRGTLDIETPITFFSHFGEAGMELYQALRDAQDNEQKMIDTLAEHIQGIVSLEQVQKAEKELFEFTTASGEKLTLSKAHIMDIYLLYNRNQGKKHLLYDPESEHFGNGIHQPEIKSKRIRRGTESTRLTKGDLGNILSKLTEEDKAIANKMQNATLLLAEWGNKACMEVFGYEKFKDPNYWTIKSAQESINQTLEKNKDIARAIKNMGSAKPIEDKATNALDIGGVFNVFNQHASDMISYSAWLGVMEDATKLYNYTFRDDDGFKTNKTFKGMLDKYAGNGGNKYYFNLLKDIQNGIGIAPDTSIENYYTKLFGMAAKAKVAFKLTVVAQQPMAIVRAADVLNPVSIAKAIGKGGLNLPVWAVSKVKNISTKDSGKLLNEWYGGWERALKYSPIAKRKSIGGYEINSNSSGLKDVLYKPDTVKGKVIDTAKESPLWAAGKADQITWGILWNSCEIETDKNTSFEKGSEAYYEDVNKLFTKVINETQVVDGVLQRSQMMRSSSGWVKPLTAFKGEPTMALNGVLRAYDNLRYETNPTKRGKAIKKFSRATTVFVMSAIFTAFARSLAVGVTGEDDEEYWKKVWKSFSGVQGDEETWFDFVKNIGLKSDAVNNVNPLSWLPVTSELMSFAQGYDVERLDVASIGDFLQAGKNFVDSLDDDGKYKVSYATRNLLFKLAELTGYSPYNLVRDIEGAIRTVRNETDDVKGLYDMEKWRTKPASNQSVYIDILHKAYTTDKEAYEEIYNDLIENGVDAEKIKSGMETRMKKAEGVEKSSDLSKRYMAPGDEKKYDNSLKKIENSSVWKSANTEEKENAKADLYDFLTSTSEAMEKTRKEARAYGVDETEYTLLQLAKEMVNDSKVSMNAKEKAEAIKMLDLGNSELAYFYNTETSEKAYANGVDIENFAMFKAAVSGLKGDDKKDKINAYAKKYARNTKEYLFFMGTEYSSYKKRSDYISYFGK